MEHPLFDNDHLQSPLHPNALRLKDIVPGREIIWHNREYGPQGQYRVLEKPSLYTFRSLYTTTLRVRLWHHKFSREEEAFLSDMGVIPYSGGGWNNVNYTIDTNDAHLLPEHEQSIADRCALLLEELHYGKLTYDDE